MLPLSPHPYHVSACGPNSQLPAPDSLCLRTSLATKFCSAHPFSSPKMPGNYHHPRSSPQSVTNGNWRTNTPVPSPQGQDNCKVCASQEVPEFPHVAQLQSLTVVMVLIAHLELMSSLPCSNPHPQCFLGSPPT